MNCVGIAIRLNQRRTALPLFDVAESATPWFKLSPGADRQKLSLISTRFEMDTQEARKGLVFFYGYIIVIIAFAIAAVVEGLLFSFGIFFEPLLSEFGWTRATTSGAVSLSTIIHIPVSIVAGKLADRFGSKQLLGACGLFLGLGYFLMSKINALWHLYVFYGVIVAVGMGLYWIPVISLVPRWFVTRRALMMGIIASGIGVGQLIFPPLVNRLISAYGWRFSFVIMGIIGIGIITVSAQFLKRDPKQVGMLPYGENVAKLGVVVTKVRLFSLRDAMRTRPFWLLSVTYFSWLFCLSVVVVHSVIHAIGIGMSPAGAANILAIVGLTGIMGRLAFGRLADVIGMKFVLVVSFILMLIAFLWLTIARNTWMCYLFAAIFGSSYGTFEILQSPLVAELFGVSSLGIISGVVHNFASTAIMIGPVLAGYIYDITGSYHVAFLLCAAMALGSIACVTLLPLTSGKALTPGAH
jgi:MFS family permease